MRRVAASAPGKVVLSGEYAVLDGAPAVSMAVDRRASVSLVAAQAARIETLGAADPADTRLLDSVLESLGLERPVAELVLDTRGFLDAVSGTKLGIGSSGALTVALVRALGSPELAVTEVFARALAAHRQFQGGAGSGVDVATSTVGGLVEYRIGVPPAPVNWPAGLQFALLWSGVAASTTARLDRLAAGDSKAGGETLAQAAVHIAGCWQQGNAAALVDEYAAYVAALQGFSVDRGLGIFDAGHDVLAACKTPANTVYKPCGAGGGDVGIVLGTDPEAIREFVDRAVAKGFRRLDIALDPTGVSMTGAAS